MGTSLGLKMKEIIGSYRRSLLDLQADLENNWNTISVRLNQISYAYDSTSSLRKPSWKFECHPISA